MVTFNEEHLAALQELLRLARMVDDFAELRAVTTRVEKALENAQFIPQETKPTFHQAANTLSPHCEEHAMYTGWCVGCNKQRDANKELW